MGLLELKTDLKSLKFGHDRLSGGDSNQPYIKEPPLHDPGQLSQANNDFLWRGGLRAPVDSLTDVVRLTKWFFDWKSPSGLLFVAKQNLLSRTAVASQASGNQSITDKWKNAALNEGVYTPLSTIAQAGVNFTGIRGYKQGLNPLKGVKTYTDVKEDVIGDKSGEGNRLVGFYNINIDKTNLSPILYSYSGGPNSNLGIGKTDIFIVPAEQRTGINNPELKNSGFFPVPTPEPPTGAFLNSDPGIFGSSNTNFTPETSETGKIAESGFNVFKNKLITLEKDKILFFNNNTVTNKYESYLGIFNTPGNLTSTLNRTSGASSFIMGATSVYNPGTINNNDRAKIFGIGAFNDKSFTTLTQIQISELGDTLSENGNPITNFQNIILQDVKLIKDDKDPKKSSTIMSVSPSYSPRSGESIEGKDGSRIEMTSPGQKGNILSYTKGKRSTVTGDSMGPVDKINALPVYSSGEVDTQQPINDLVKFRIASIDKRGNKSQIHFRAFINSFSDKYGAKWNGIQYMGRGEELFKYGGFSRNISIAFTVAAQSKPELMVQYKKLNYLASMLAPDYGSSGYMGGVISTLTVGGWCYEQPGFIGDLTLEIPEESPWEIAINDDGDPDPSVKELPHIVNVGMGFTPIHQFVPQLQTENGEGPSRFLALSTEEYGNQGSNYTGNT